MAATCVACTAACCSLCCCWCESVLCGNDKSNFETLVELPPSTSQVQRFITSLRQTADPNGEPDVCCYCLPKSIVCCLPRCCCPCIFSKPDPVSTVKARDVIQVAQQVSEDDDSNDDNKKSFLGHRLAMRYTTRLFKSQGDASECRFEYMSAGLILLSIGKLREKLKALFESFEFAVGGVFNKEALLRTLRSLMKTVIDIAKRIADFVTGVLPGGKTVKLMLTTLHGTVGKYFVENRVDRMLQRNDIDRDGAISFDEFEKAANTRDSLIRKTLAWAEHKTKVLRGETSNDLTGGIVLDGTIVWARVIDTDVEAKQCLEYWETEDQIGQDDKRLGIISLQEPCAIDDGTDENDNRFVIVDAQKKTWTIECATREEFFAWYDAVDGKCDAKLQDNDLQPDDGLMADYCPSSLVQMFG